MPDDMSLDGPPHYENPGLLANIRPSQTGGSAMRTLQSLHQGIGYVVTMGKPNQGVTNVELLGPYNYSR